MRRAVGVKGREGAAGQLRHLLEDRAHHGIVAFLEDEHGHVHDAELARLVTQRISVFFQGVADEHHRLHLLPA